MASLDNFTHIPDPSQAADQAKSQLGSPHDYMPPVPQPDPSALPQQLPGGLGDAANQASQLSEQMQGMSCPNFNPGMPGADMAEQMSQHLQTMSDSAQQIMNPAQQELSNVQTAISNVQTNPAQSNIDQLNNSLQDLQSKTSQVYGNVPNAQTASQYVDNAQAQANQERDLAQQRAANAMQQETQKYNDLSQQAQNAQQQAQQKYQDAQNAGSAEASKYQQQAQQYQQQAQAYQAKAQAAQQAAQNMQSQIPPYQGPDFSQLPQNPYQNLNSTLQNISLPDCPQLGDLQNQLTNVQGEWQQVMGGYDSLAVTLQGVGDLKEQVLALPESIQAQIDTDIADIHSALGGDEAKPEEETGEDGGAAPTMPVVNGGSGMCPMAMGAEFQVITVPTGSEINMQQKAQPLQAQFMCPGQCMSLANPITAAQTAAALGVLTPGKCLIMAKSPVPVAWQPMTTGTYMGNNQPFLLAPSSGTCMFGGPLMMTDAGQTDVTATPGG